ncbi:MAG TPA: bifunctional UDP-N-acetylglucosamine diphosphorylase/glucosamine-1-phosphate N-acetyltransferase GlmU, partial [Cyclobacteriaceae bacterium]|nr:bifunctional UDP-N-acetylglucosamine diphosphorylase/glucosamine-1-phosphate N-acetyltransferase GlmU [Cyclobacteriaceae bacterium]
MLEVVILAAGKGTRMRSRLPKVLHTLAGKPFVAHVLDRSQELHAGVIHLVVGFGADQVRTAFADQEINFVEQREQLGTGHAVQQAMNDLKDDSLVLILYGDVPLIKTETLKNLLRVASENSMGLLTVRLDNPQGYGRILRDTSGKITAIVEQKDASAEQLEIKEINTGVMALTAKHLKAWLPTLDNNNAQGEYYLTDLIEIAVKNNVEVVATHPESELEVTGVNDRKQQAELERIFQRNIADKLLEQGVSLADPSRFDCRGEMEVGADTFIDINCVFEGKVVLGENVIVGPNSYIKNSTIESNTHIYANTIIENSYICDNCNIGPFARVRPDTRLESGARLGNFVETKKAHIGKGSKVNHLSYVGDAEVGEDVNIGAGTITCNYDGANKHLTQIGDRVFVGSNTA